MPESDEDAREAVEKVFGVRPCLWQLKAARMILGGQDTLTIAPTGSGKTLSYWLELVFVPEGTIVVVTPLKDLGSQFENELKQKGFCALNVTGNITTNNLYKDIASLKYRVVIFSPESIVNDSRFDDLLSNRKFMRSVISFVFDEAHVIEQWGGTFRPEYQKLGPLRYIMVRHVPYQLGSATLPPIIAQKLTGHLHLGQDTKTIWLDTDRKNIFLRVQRMKHPLNSYRDLAPLLQTSKKFIVFFNSRNAAQDGARFLRSCLPVHEMNDITWVHSGMSDDFRREEIGALKAGLRRGVCATDAIGMGIDIPDIGIVVQYGSPQSLSTWYQRAGRAVRDLSLQGTAVVLVEPKFFDAEKHAAFKAARQAENVSKQAAAEAARVREALMALASASEAYVHAGKPKRKRGAGDTSMRKKGRPESQPEVTDLKTCETDIFGYPIKIERAMDDFINAENRPGKCRRGIGSEYFGNLELERHVNTSCCSRAGCSPPAITHCCNICEPEYSPFLTNEHIPTREAEVELRRVIAVERDAWFLWKLGPHAMLMPEALWPDSVVDAIVDWAHEGKLDTVESFCNLITWAYAEELAPKLLEKIQATSSASPTTSFSVHIYRTSPVINEFTRINTKQVFRPENCTGTLQSLSNRGSLQYVECSV
ncbi:P-loop containing nucleoside triphosphate hydrolase protein [Lentinula edodes]|nr:P-loop containing nucleoside triphosphate hydrolase protein [Lentinula edodes]